MNTFSEIWIKERIEKNDYYFSLHGDRERQNDNLTIAEVEEALIRGIILEHYFDTGRGASCLVAGFTQLGKPIHIVCGKRNNGLVVVTVYIPQPPDFLNVFQRSN